MQLLPKSLKAYLYDTISHSGIWKQALMSDFYSFADSEIRNLTFFTRVYSITYSRVRIVRDKSYRVDRPKRLRRINTQ